MDVELRAVSMDELPAFLWADSTGFGHAVDRARRNMAAWELDRTVAAFERDRIVGVSRNYSFELTLPGGALVPAAGVSDVSVLPTHRRRGLLRTMMDRLLDDAVAHGECVAMLTASEGGIYGRFGFGVTIRSCSVEIDTVAAEFPEPAPVGTLRLVELEEACAFEPEIFDRARRVQPGAVSRFDPWWTDEQFHTEMGARFDVVFESPEGSLDGYLTYGIRQQWGTGGPNHRLAVSDLVAVTPVASNALWRYACEVDLVRTVFARQRADRSRGRLVDDVAARRAHQRRPRLALDADRRRADGSVGTDLRHGRLARPRSARLAPSGRRRRRPVRVDGWAPRRDRWRDHRRPRARHGHRVTVGRMVGWCAVQHVGARRTRRRGGRGRARAPTRCSRAAPFPSP